MDAQRLQPSACGLRAHPAQHPSLLRLPRTAIFAEGLITILIIIEGTDGSGKSTLAQRIAEDLQTVNPTDRVELWHATPPKPGEHPLDLYEKPLWDYRPGTGHHIIADRHHIGEWIYPGVLNRPTLADTAVWRHLDLFLQARGAVLVHATPSIKQIIANVEDRGDDLIKVRQLQGIHASYIAMVAASRLPKIRYVDIGNPFIPGEVMRLGRYMEGHVQHLREFVTYIGHHKPKYLLLGDVRHGLRDHAHQMIAELSRSFGPAFGPYRGTSGHFLLEHLPWDLLHEGRLGIANACDVDDPERLWHALGQPQTVALGQNAAKASPYAIRRDHPQYVRRFHNKLGSEYGQAIVEGFRW